MTNIASDMPYQRLATNDKLMSDKYTSLSSTIEKCGKLNPDAIVPVILECQEIISAAISNTVDVLAIQSCLRKLLILDVNLAVLAATKIGKIIKPLKKIETTGDVTIASLANRLIDEWRKLVSTEMPLETRVTKGSVYQRDDIATKTARSRYLRLLVTALSRPILNAEDIVNGDGPTEKTKQDAHLVQLARECEREVYERNGNSCKVRSYVSKIRQLTSNLGNRKDSSLRYRVLNGTVKIRELLEMSVDELASSATREERQKILREKELKERGSGTNVGLPLSSLRCPSCDAPTVAKSTCNDTDWVSAGRTALIRCDACGHRWEGD